MNQKHFSIRIPHVLCPNYHHGDCDNHMMKQKSELRFPFCSKDKCPREVIK